MIRMATFSDISDILSLYECARRRMQEEGNPFQWGKTYPPKDLILKDIKEESLYVMKEGSTIYGVFYFKVGVDPTYQEIEGKWLSEEPYGAIHRIAGNLKYRGVLASCIRFCEKKISHLRIDTHKDNHKMRSLLERNGFQFCGVIKVEDGSPRMAFERI